MNHHEYEVALKVEGVVQQVFQRKDGELKAKNFIRLEDGRNYQFLMDSDESQLPKVGDAVQWLVGVTLLKLELGYEQEKIINEYLKEFPDLEGTDPMLILQLIEPRRLAGISRWLANKAAVEAEEAKRKAQSDEKIFECAVSELINGALKNQVQQFSEENVAWEKFTSS